MNVIKLNIKCDSSLLDSLSDYLMGVFNAAVEFQLGKDDSLTAVIQAFLQDEPGSPIDLNELERQVAAYCAELAGIFCTQVPSVSSMIIADQDWSVAWKEHFKPFSICDGLVIAPSWEDYQVQQGEQVIVMDPGMAFGTGHHATTRLCLWIMQKTLNGLTDARVLDVGTGTGILAMASALFGAVSIEAVDNDPEAVAAARKNVARNGLDSRISVSDRPLSRLSGRYQLVVANIVQDVLLALADDLARLTDSGGYIVLSGLIQGEQVERIVSCFEKRGFSLLREEGDGEWGAVLLRKD